MSGVLNDCDALLQGSVIRFVNPNAALASAIGAAQGAADAAAQAAATANALLEDIASDSKLTPSEKPEAVAKRDAILAEQAGIEAQATGLSITTEKTAYTAAVTALSTYLGTLAGWNTIPGSTVNIVGADFRAKFADVYAKRQALLNKITATIQANAAAAKSTADSAAQAAATAQGVADAANVAISDMTRDDLLSPAEKPSENLRWITVVGERPGIDAQAAALGIDAERTAYVNSYNALSTYIGGLGAGFATIPGSTISIVGATYRTNFKNYFDAKQALLNAIAAKSATTANYDSVTGRPYDVSNLVKKGTFEDGSLGTWSSGFVEAVSSAGTSYKNQLTTVARDVIESGNKFPVTPGEKLYFLANLNALVTGFTCAFGVVAYDKNNVAMYCQVCYRSPGQGFGLVEGVLTVPAGAVAATPWLQQDGPPGFTGNYLGANGLWIGRHALGATVGAPAGTNVGSTPATTIEANANGAATAILSTFSASLNAGSMTGNFASGTRTLGSRTLTFSGGTGPYSAVSWVITGDVGDGVNFLKISGDGTSTVTVTAAGNNVNLKAVVTGSGIDANNRLAKVSFIVNVNLGTPA